MTSRHSAWHARLALAISALVLGSVTTVISQGQPQTPPVITGQEPVRQVVFIGGAPRKLTDMTAPAPPPDNPFSEAKLSLGRELFFDPVLSKDRTVSCAQCHDPGRAFADDKPLAIGIANRVGRRHSPAIINRAFGRAHFWDGRASTLEMQVVMPISDPNEMDLPIADAVSRLSDLPAYRSAFNDVFGRPVSAEDLGRALATYLRSLTSTNSPYDRFVGGDTAALSAEQQKGLQLFRGKARCIFCHVEPLFTDEQFQNTGVAWRAETATYQDEGRGGVSQLERDRGKFKTPTLREVARTAPYMHDGSLATLLDVVEFYNNGGRPNKNLFPILRPLGLTADEKQALIKFLEALSGTVTR